MLSYHQYYIPILMVFPPITQFQYLFYEHFRLANLQIRLLPVLIFILNKY